MARWWIKLLPRPVKKQLASFSYRRIVRLCKEDVLVREVIRIAGEHYDVRKGRRYASTVEEVEAALSELPAELRSLFEPYRVYLHNICANQRREVGLQV